MGYVYSALWVLIALMLFFRFRKENKVVYVMAVYFIFLGTWWFIDEFVTGINLMEGAYVWVLRIVSAVMLLIAIPVYYLERKDHAVRKTDEDTVQEENADAQ